MTGCDGKNGTKCFFLWIKITESQLIRYNNETSHKRSTVILLACEYTVASHRSLSLQTLAAVIAGHHFVNVWQHYAILFRSHFK